MGRSLVHPCAAQILNMHRILLVALFSLAQLALPAAAARAQGSCTAPSADCVAMGELDLSVSIGIGERSNPVAGASDIPLVIVPHVSYYAERFFLENLELGYSLYESDAHTINLLATPGYDRVFFVRDDPQNVFGSGATGGLSTPLEAEAPLAPRKTTYFTGLEWLTRKGPLIGQIGAFYEATGRHKGYEVRAAAAAPVVQSTHSLVVSAGFTWKSAEVVRYYYGVDARYEPGPAFNPFVRLGYSRPLAERWALTAFVHYERLADAIADSPIVGDAGVTTMFAGVVFKIL